jgi:hypothetical protein
MANELGVESFWDVSDEDESDGDDLAGFEGWKLTEDLHRSVLIGQSTNQPVS